MVLLGAGASSAQASKTVGGGSSYTDPPVIKSLKCSKGCPGLHNAQPTATSMKINGGAFLKVSGRNLGAVKKIIFLGGKSAGDEARATPTKVGTQSVTAKVPASAVNGPVQLLDDALRKSKPSAVKLNIQAAAIPGDPNNTTLIWPVHGSIVSPFGENRGDHMHSGIDISSSTGTPIKAAAAGKVIYSGSAGGYGNFVCLAHATISTCYAHQSRIVAQKGSQVGQGGVIGYVGCTGNCSGPHLHFEVRKGTKMWATAVDPVPYLPKGGNKSHRSSAASFGAPQDWGLPVNGLSG
jgi:murein DD-endopeptidase MepM/ murein hydrolase activator NlpD